MTTLNINFKNKDQAKKDFAAIKIEIKWEAANKVWTTEASVEEIRAAAAERYKDHHPSYREAFEEYLPAAQVATVSAPKSVAYELYNQNGRYFG